MKTVANLFAQTYARLGADQQQDRHFISLERLAPEEDNYCSFVKRVEGLAQNEYWVAREKNILMLLKRIPAVVRLRKEEKNGDSYQTIKTKDAGISLAHWLHTKPRLVGTDDTVGHPFVHALSFLQLARGILVALKEIHHAGVIHGQLRPDNICIPYHPYPYDFDSPLTLDFNNVCLIDFMFAISNTLRLSRYLPILVSKNPSTQSALMQHALLSDQQNRQADVIQRIDYSVDLYALGFILKQLFQKNLIYPQGLEAELSMGIHHLINELLQYNQGIPEKIKIRYLHLHPHPDYLKQVEQLISRCQPLTSASTISFLFDPAQFLEEDSVFNIGEVILNSDGIVPAQSSGQAAVLETTPNNLATPIEIKTMKDNQPSLSLKNKASANDGIEVSKILVIALIVTLQILYVIYTDGKSMGLDVLASMGLVAAIGLGVIFAMQIFAPTKPLPKSRPSIFNEGDAKSAVASTSTDKPTDELEQIAASVAPVITTSSASLEQRDTAPTVDKAATDDHDTQTPPVILLKTPTPAAKAKESEPMEVNKWLVIAVIVALQIGYVLLTTDLSGNSTTQTTTTTEESPAPVESIVEEPAIIEPTPSEDILATPTVEDGSAANIELLSEASSVSTPQVTNRKATKDTTVDSLLLSGSPVNEPKVKKEKPVAVAKETPVQGHTAIPLTKEQADFTNKSPEAIANNTPEPVSTSTTTNDNNSVNANDTKTVAPKTASTPKSLTRGLAEAQNNMGWHYYHGDGVKQNYEEAFKWFVKAANLNLASAQYNVGEAYQKGEGIKQDLTEAARWYTKSAEQGNAGAQLNLGMMYISGRGIRQNIEEGTKWLNKAAEQGDVTAKANLAWLSQQGYIKADNAEAKAE